jgi:hypothetical protein
MHEKSRKPYEIPQLTKVGALSKVTASFSCPPGFLPDPRDGIGCIDEDILS